MNFKNFGYDPPTENGYSSGGRSQGNFSLTRQSSIYSLTFDELQSTLGGSGKDFGSMNMDELLKNIWSAEETQTMASCSTTAAKQVCANSSVNLQRQGSITLPRTLSQKTVDEVWRDLSNVDDLGKGGNGGILSMPRRQPTLGEMTLEEFLFKAGVVREDNQFVGKPNNGGFFGYTNGLGIDFQQPDSNTGLVGNRILDNTSQIPIQSSNLPLNVDGVRSNHQQQQKIFPKQPAVTYGQLPLSSSSQLEDLEMKEGSAGYADNRLNSNVNQRSVLQSGRMGVIGLKGGHVNVATGSPGNQVSSDGIGKSNGDISSISSVPYMFNGGLRGRRSNGTVEKAAERRQKRMIKNRESAARSRARKQAYTTELEAEVATLKEENEKLQKKQEAMMQIQKNQEVEMMNMLKGGKRICLRRTQTGPW